MSLDESVTDAIEISKVISLPSGQPVANERSNNAQPGVVQRTSMADLQDAEDDDVDEVIAVPGGVSLILQFLFCLYVCVCLSFRRRIVRSNLFLFILFPFLHM